MGRWFAVKRATLVYLTSYLSAGGAGFLLAPDLTLTLFLSTGDYGEIMPRVVGMFMLVLAGIVFQWVAVGDFRYYRYTIYARSFIVGVLTLLYFRSADPLFLVLDAVVLIGLVPSMYVLAAEGRG
jgi:lipid-A-disaccharide synthase-like uncharacterized protein